MNDKDNRVQYSVVPDDRRQSVRIAPTEEGARGSILLKNKMVSVRVLNQSAGGFLVGLKSHHNLKLGDTTVLRADGGYWNVQIVHCEDVADGHNIGVRRLGETSRPAVGNRAVPIIVAGIIAIIVVGFFFYQNMVPIPFPE